MPVLASSSPRRRELLTLATEPRDNLGPVGILPTAEPSMPSVEKISIALPPEMVALVRQAVDAGEYASSSEVVRDALRDWTRRRTLRQQGIDELRKVWQQAMDDSTPGVPASEVLDRLERKYQALADGAEKAR